MNKTFRAGVVTLALIYFLILVGGIVRSTGAGMGCPDWPKCFDSYIPPTSESQLPENYADLLLEKRIAKNKKLAKFISIFSDEKTLNHNYTEKIKFNVTKAWIEYLNRIVGVVIGLSVIILAFLSIKNYWNLKRTISYLAIGVFVLTVLQGWIGSVVVSTNLLPGLITIHMLIATLICFSIIGILFMIKKEAWVKADSFKMFPQTIMITLVTVILASLAQIHLGTMVRESVDIISKTTDIARNVWLDSIGLNFYIHRSLSLFILFINIYLIYIIYISKANVPYKLHYWLISIILIEILSGVIFYYMGFPAFLQPLHLLLANLMIGIQFFLFVFSYRFKGLYFKKGEN